MIEKISSVLKKSWLFVLSIILINVKFTFASEVNLSMPKLNSVKFFNNLIAGNQLLMLGFPICLFGIFFGIYLFIKIKKLPLHISMRSISELIYETCKTYFINQCKLVFILEILLSIIIFIYFRLLQHLEIMKTFLIIFCSFIGVLGSYAVSWFGIRVNTYANAKTAFTSLKNDPVELYEIPLNSGISIGMVLVSIELLIMLIIILFIPIDLAGACFIGFAIGESLGASVLRIAGGIFTKIADIGSDLMKIAFNIKEDDARNPGVIADCVGDNAGDSIGPTADGFETYGVTGVALIVFITLAVNNYAIQAKLLIWIFIMRLMMIITSAIAYKINTWVVKLKYSKNSEEFNFEFPLTSIIWLTAITSISTIFLVSKFILGDLPDNTFWWKLSSIISCGVLASTFIPEMVKCFTSIKSSFVQNIVDFSKRGGASLNIISGLTSGNFSAYFMGLTIILLMSTAYFISSLNLAALTTAPTILAFGLVAFGFLSMGPVTIAVDSYGPVVDNAQSIYELSLIEKIKNIEYDIKDKFGFNPIFKSSKLLLEKNDSAGNTFKATAKPVLIGTAVTGATTMIFSTIVMLTNNLQNNLCNLSILYPPFLFGLIAGGSIIYWFTGAANHAVASGSYKAIEFIKNTLNIKKTNLNRASLDDSKKVVKICTKYAQKGMLNLFLVILFSTLSYAFIEPYFFIGYLISITLFGLFQATFMANAGGAWDNAKKFVEVNLQENGTDLHKATVIGDTVGDPFKDTSSVSINPVIKFATLFGLLAIEIAIKTAYVRFLNIFLAFVFFILSIIFVIKSFFSMKK